MHLLLSTLKTLAANTMVLLKSCCCWQSVRSGSFASGIYTLTFYSVVVTAGSFHVHTILTLPEPLPVLLVFSILMLAFAALSVMSSVALLVGLCTNNRIMLLPWIGSITMTTVLDVILSFYLIFDSEIDPFFGVLVATDIVICAINVYCILCVISQFQEYSADRARAGQIINAEIAPPAIHFEAASTARRANQSPSSKVSVSILPTDSSPNRSMTRPLLSAGGSPISRKSPPSPGLGIASSPLHLLSRGSFSSTTEISYCSSEGLPGSRRGSSLPPQDPGRQGLSPVGEVQPFPGASEMSPVESEAQEEKTERKLSVGAIDTLSKAGEVLSKFRTSTILPSNVLHKIPSKIVVVEDNDPDAQPIEPSEAVSQEPEDVAL